MKAVENNAQPLSRFLLYCAQLLHKVAKFATNRWQPKIKTQETLDFGWRGRVHANQNQGFPGFYPGFKA
jgi:hypothetical protein